MWVASMTNDSVLNEDTPSRTIRLVAQPSYQATLDALDLWHRSHVFTVFPLLLRSSEVCHAIPDHLPLCAESEELEIIVVY